MTVLLFGTKQRTLGFGQNLSSYLRALQSDAFGCRDAGSNHPCSQTQKEYSDYSGFTCRHIHTAAVGHVIQANKGHVTFDKRRVEASCPARLKQRRDEM